jgi:hypothetical protein
VLKEKNLKNTKFVTLALVCTLLSGCADHSDKVRASYVSPMQYQDYSCRQIRAEIMNVSHKVNEIAGIQDKTATNDSVAMGVGLVLFWPALFFIEHGDQHVQLAELKGQYEALEHAAIQKNCDVVKEINASKKMAEERKAKEKKANTSNNNNNNN